MRAAKIYTYVPWRIRTHRRAACPTCPVTWLTQICATNTYTYMYFMTRSHTQVDVQLALRSLWRDLLKYVPRTCTHMFHSAFTHTSRRAAYPTCPVTWLICSVPWLLHVYCMRAMTHHMRMQTHNSPCDMTHPKSCCYSYLCVICVPWHMTNTSRRAACLRCHDSNLRCSWLNFMMLSLVYVHGMCAMTHHIHEHTWISSCGMTHPHACCDCYKRIICTPWPIAYTSTRTTHPACPVTWLIHMRAMTPTCVLYVCHDAFTYTRRRAARPACQVTWLIHMRTLATVSRIDYITGLFRRILSLL